MNKKRIIAAVLSLCMASALASCGSKNKTDVNVIVNTEAADNSQNNNINNTASGQDAAETAEDADEQEYIPVIGGTDAYGYTVTGIPVTDAAGEKVTDSAGAQVTEIAVVDDKGNIVTDAEGNNMPPQYTQNIIDQAMAELENFSEITPDSKSTSNSVLWLSSLTKNITVTDEKGTPKTKPQIKEVSNPEGELFTVTFKIAEDAPAGNYEIKFGRSDAGSKGSFCGDTEMNYQINYYNGFITVGSAEAPGATATNGRSCYFGNVTAEPGSTVTMPCNLTGVNGIAAFNAYFSYDSQYISVTEINAGSVISGKGDFLCS